MPARLIKSLLFIFGVRIFRSIFFNRNKSLIINDLMLAYYILQLIKTPKDSFNKCSIYIAFTELTESCSWEWFPKHLQKFQALDWRHFQRLNEHPGRLGWFLARYAFCGVPLRYIYIYICHLQFSPQIYVSCLGDFFFRDLSGDVFVFHLHI